MAFNNPHIKSTSLWFIPAMLSDGVSLQSKFHLIGFPETGKAIAMPGVSTDRHERSERPAPMYAQAITLDSVTPQFPSVKA